MRPLVYALHVLGVEKPSYFKGNRTASFITVPRPPLILEGDYVGTTWQKIISPSAVYRSTPGEWLDQYWWVVDSIGDRIEPRDVRDQVAASLRLNSKQAAWVLPVTVMKRRGGVSLLLAFTLYGLLASGAAQVQTIGPNTFTVLYNEELYGIQDRVVLDTKIEVPPFDYAAYLAGELAWRHTRSTAQGFNSVWRAARKAGDDEALMLLRALYWNTHQLSRIERLIENASALTKRGSYDDEEE